MLTTASTPRKTLTTLAPDFKTVAAVKLPWLYSNHSLTQTKYRSFKSAGTGDVPSKKCCRRTIPTNKETAKARRGWARTTKAAALPCLGSSSKITGTCKPTGIVPTKTATWWVPSPLATKPWWMAKSTRSITQKVFIRNIIFPWPRAETKRDLQRPISCSNPRQTSQVQENRLRMEQIISNEESRRSRPSWAMTWHHTREQTTTARATTSQWTLCSKNFTSIWKTWTQRVEAVHVATPIKTFPRESTTWCKIKQTLASQAPLQHNCRLASSPIPTYSLVLVTHNSSLLRMARCRTRAIGLVAVFQAV